MSESREQTKAQELEPLIAVAGCTAGFAFGCGLFWISNEHYHDLLSLFILALSIPLVYYGARLALKIYARKEIGSLKIRNIALGAAIGFLFGVPFAAGSLVLIGFLTSGPRFWIGCTLNLGLPLATSLWGGYIAAKMSKGNSA